MEPGGHAITAEAPDLLDVELGEDGGHPKRLTTSAGQRSTLQGLVGSLDEGCCLHASEEGH